MAQAGHPDWHVRLRRILDTYFDQGELETLCFDLRFDYEALPGVGKSEKVVDLIKAFSRMGRIEELIDYCSQLRPNVPWAELRAEAARDPFAVERPPDRYETTPPHETTGRHETAASAPPSYRPAPPPPHATAPIPLVHGTPQAHGAPRSRDDAGPRAHPAPPSHDDAAPTASRRRGWVGVLAVVGVALVAVFGWCGLTDANCPWETVGTPTAQPVTTPEPEPEPEREPEPVPEPEPEPAPAGPTILTFDPNVLVNLFVPEQLEPGDGTVFDTFPRTTTLRWTSVQGVESYTVELDCMGCCASREWCTDIGETWQVVRGITEETHTFDWVGAQPGRWRVWAVGADGFEYSSSPWWYFEYTR